MSHLLYFNILLLKTVHFQIVLQRGYFAEDLFL